MVDEEVDKLNMLEAVLKKEVFNNIYKSTLSYEAIKMCKQMAPDLIVLDIMLPDIDGFEVCRRLREFCLVPIIFLSAKDEDVDKLLGLGIGGDDYITKPFSPKEVAFRIKAHFRRSEYFNLKSKTEQKRIIRFGDIEIDEDRAEVRKNKKIVTLTNKEYKLLLFLAQNPNKILSKSQILDRVGVVTLKDTKIH